MKKLFIIEHRAHEYANRLLNDMSIYAYSIERNRKVFNVSFFEQSRVLRGLYTLYAWMIDKWTRGKAGVWALGGAKFLPPTETMPSALETQKTLYFFGWMFRNPVGLTHHRKQIIEKFGPSPRMKRKIENLMAPIPKDRIHIGVHLRLIPFKGFDDGEFLVSSTRVREIVDEYLREKTLPTQDVELVIACDQPLLAETFEGYTTHVYREDAATSLFLLSTCSVVIGTNTTLSNVAAWFGNVPHIVTKKTLIDWRYYFGKDTYFENKYADFAQ
ncbi:MAG: Uncharacterized protein G01um101456_484 [Parcubacteria group bacterium Gr01-1014_56]|nr:MAG: Uncharacterized protein G01um101456_484 [Parcubacteria group bacterium Gr01-1014_56]